MSRSGEIGRRSLRAAALRTATLTLITLAIAGALGAVLLSPLALSRLPAGQRLDWSTLSDVGQTYGAASAVLSVLALGGVVFSLNLQRRESKAAREQALRGLHTDLLRMALDDRTFLECWGPIGASTDVAWYRQHIYLNLIVSHWQMMWEIGSLSEAHLRLLAAGVFGGPLGRRYWREAREARWNAETGQRAKAFHRIVDSEYQSAPRSAPEPGPDAAKGTAQPRSSSRTALVWIAAGAVAGVAAARVIVRRPRRHTRARRTGVRPPW